MATNVKDPPYKTVDLDRFLGLFTEADPASLPEGASALCLNDDFTVGGVLPRPGTESVFSLSESNNCELAVNAGGGGGGSIGPFDAEFGVQTTPSGTVVQTLNLAVNPTVKSYCFLTCGMQGAFPSIPGLAVPPGMTAVNGPTNFGLDAEGVFAPGSPVRATETQIYSNAFGAVSAAAGVLASFPVKGTPVTTQLGGSSTANNAVLSAAVAAGTSLLVAVFGATNAAASVSSFTDTNGNVYVKVGGVTQFNGGQYGALAYIFFCANAVGNAAGHNVTYSYPDAFVSGVAFHVYTVTNLGSGSWQNPLNAVGPLSGKYATVTLNPGQASDELQTTNYGFNVPLASVIDSISIEVNAGLNLFGFPGLFLTASLIYQGAVIANIFPDVVVFPNAATDTVAQFSITNASTGGVLTPAIINDPSFGVQFAFTYSGSGGPPRVARLAAPQMQIALSFTTGLDFNYLKTFEQTGGEVNTLALDDQGTIWQEDAVNAPGILKNIFSGVEPGMFAQSATLDDREFMAFSNLLNGTDVPRAYNGKSFPRLSQVGPGAPPTASSTSTGSAILNITQNPAFPMPAGPHGWILVSNQAGSGSGNTPGNVLTLFFPSNVPVPAYITPGTNIVLAGFPTVNGNRINNDPAGLLAPKFYTVSTVGLPIPGNLAYTAIVVTVNFTTFYTKAAPSGGTIQATLATMTTAAAVPDLEVGSQFNVSGTGGAPPTGYDNTWLVLETPNASQLQIVSTVLLNNIATYGFNLISGTAPVVGQAVTVTGTLNGNGIFNVSQAIITSVTAGTFSIALQGANIGSAAEDADGVIFGTIFIFDAFAIVGNKTGGQIVTVGIIAAGVRKICYSFLTEDGFMTKPSPICTYDVPIGASALAIAGLLPGPSNVIARVIHLTGADGGNFYNIPVPVTVISNGQNVVNSSTYVNDNKTTGVVLSFSDDVLTSAIQIDTAGNNLFETGELGAPVALVPYAGRLFAVGEQDKVQNFLNLSFDGGIGIIRGDTTTGGTGSDSTYPAGWKVDPTSGSGGSVIPSPIFGFAYLIQAVGGSHFSPSGPQGMITQPAFQDEFEVPIIEPSTTYSVRVTTSVAGFTGTGRLAVDLFSPSIGRSLGTYNLDLTTVTGQMAIYTGTLLTIPLAPVPSDLLLRVYATDMTNGANISIDRVEPFPTEAPNLSTQIIGSYQGNFEAFDRVSGVVDVSVQNQQPAKSAFTLFDTFYIVKSGSLLSTQDNKTTEPGDWATPRVISNVVGTPSIYGVAGVIDEESGEEWAVIAGQPGAFLFSGGQPIPISEEIKSAWNQINWQYGHTLWVKNDVVNRRILIGVPMKARDINGNFPIWLPQGTVADTQNPTTPNVILTMNYQFLSTAGAIEARPEIHVSSFGGKLISTDMSRKWSIWTLAAPCAAFIKRSDTTAPLMLGNSADTAKIYQFVKGLLSDDGAAFRQDWISHGFVTPEQEQGLQLGSVRKMYPFATMILNGSGPVTITVHPDKVNGPYTHALLPNLTLPATVSGDVELPVNETGNRLFMQFTANTVGAGFALSRIVLAVAKDPWAQVRGRNA